MRPQERLAPERELAGAIGCSRETLRRALEVLEREGLIWRHVGQGTFIGPRPSTEPIRPAVLIEMATPGQVLEARLLLEPEIAAAAASCARSADTARLRELARLTGEAETWQAYESADDAFHRTVARITANPLLIGLLDTLSNVRGRALWQRRHDMAFRAARKREYALDQARMHAVVVDAIGARDPAAARTAMREHLVVVSGLMSVGTDGSACS